MSKTKDTTTPPAAKAPRRTRKAPAATATAPISPEEIARRAYDLHLAGGSDELDNWLRAERELAGARS